MPDVDPEEVIDVVVMDFAMEDFCELCIGDSQLTLQ